MRLQGLLLVSLLLASAANAQSAWINELHYDNTGTDVNEGVEIAGPAGTDFDNWTLIAYDGTSGSQYASILLTGVIPDQSSGFGTIAFSFAALQNGSPDGLALIDGASQVVEFISYEGSFVATNGPAIGLMSTDIGLSESTVTPIGESLQLVGSGSQAGDFVWSGPVTSSMGFPNAGQSFGIVGAGSRASRWEVGVVRPNPIRTTGSLIFEIPQRARIAVAQYQVSGRLVGRYEASFEPGRYSVPVLTDALPAGIYFIRLEAIDESGVLRMRTTRKVAILGS